MGCETNKRRAGPALRRWLVSFGGLVLVSYLYADKSRFSVSDQYISNLVFLSIIFFALCVKYVRISCNVNLH